MRFLFTACWHLGRRLHGRDRTEDQAHALDALVELAREVRPAAVLVGGDVHDAGAPAPEQVELADDVLGRLVRGLSVPVVLLAGGDAAAPALPAGARLLAEAGLHLVHGASDASRPVVFEDGDGVVRVHALPPRGCARAARADLERTRAALGPRSVLLAHAAAGVGDDAGAAVPRLRGADVEGFRVALLGHGHSPTRSRDGRLVTCGAPLALDLDDAGAKRGVHLVEIDAAGACRVEHVELPARRAVRRLEGRLDALAAAQDGPSADLVVLRLTDPEPCAGLLERARAAFPELLLVERAPAGDRPLDLGELLAGWTLARGEEPLDAEEQRVVRELAQHVGLPQESAP